MLCTALMTGALANEQSCEGRTTGRVGEAALPPTHPHPPLHHAAGGSGLPCFHQGRGVSRLELGQMRHGLAHSESDRLTEVFGMS